jgi:hypothetical protein
MTNLQNLFFDFDITLIMIARLKTAIKIEKRYRFFLNVLRMKRSKYEQQTHKKKSSDDR